MARLDADCVLALAPLRLKPGPRRFIIGLSLRARLALAERPAPPLSPRQSQWLYELVIQNERAIRNPQLVRDARTMLRHT